MIEISVNGRRETVPAGPGTPLLFALRNDLGLRAAKLGCALEQCRACTVLVDGTPRTSCTTPVESLGAAEVTTLEGLADDDRFAPFSASSCLDQVTTAAPAIRGAPQS